MSSYEEGASRQQRRNKKWQERQDRSRVSREESIGLLEKLKELKKQVNSNEDGQVTPEPTKFSDLPISARTMQGLERGNYTHLTRIQSAALPAALVGRDILGAAKTGSGKTLTFLIPVLERLWLEQWSSESGVGAIVLSPTRELALQTFKVLQVIGVRHQLSAALLTGGRNVEEEKSRLHAINVIIGTPGRILHHMTETSNLSVENLLMLVFDEADRLLDMGFRETITSILEQLPKNNGRQTLLFSATQTRDVQMLSQVCCMGAQVNKKKNNKNNKINKLLQEEEDEKNEDENEEEIVDEDEDEEDDNVALPPIYITDYPTHVAATPAKLNQNFIVIDLHRKLDLLYVFLRRHAQDKIVVFASTQNQVRFMFLAFSRLLRKTKIPAMCLTGKMKQFRREEVFMTFCRCKSAVLFCTDIAARGLDFPMVHWVVQFDCPESPQTYVHRAGRTARAGARGVSLLLLTPTELPMLSYLAHKNIPMREIAVKDHMLMDTKQMFVALAIQGLKLDAQKACIGYLRSLHFASNKNVFCLDSVDTESFANSLGLNTVPDLSTVTTGRSAKNLPWDVQNFMTALKKQQEKKQQQQPSSAAAAYSNNNNNNNINKQQKQQKVQVQEIFEDEDEEEEEDEDDTTSTTKQDKSNLTRRERHLAASDMFTSLQAAQRFNVKKKSYFGSDDENEQDDANFIGKKNQNKNKQQEQEQEEELFTKRKDISNNTPALTAEDRLKGLSKHKQRRFIETADLRVKDLNLNKRIKFGDSDDDEQQQQQEQENDNLVDDVLGEMEIVEAPKEKERLNYMNKLQSQVKSSSAEDKLRTRERKFQILEKKGLIAPKGGKGGEEDEDEDDFSDDDDFDSSSEDDDEGEGNNKLRSKKSKRERDLEELFMAAKGELYESGDDEEDQGEGEGDDQEVVEEEVEEQQQQQKHKRNSHPSKFDPRKSKKHRSE